MRWLLALLFCIPAFGQDFASVAVVGNLFHPREIAGIQTHFDTTKLAGANGDTCTNYWDHISGKTFVQQVLSQAPTILITNGVKVVLHDGVDDYMKSLNFSVTGSCTVVFCGLSFKGVGDYTTFYSGSSGPDNLYFFNLYQRGTNLSSFLNGEETVLAKSNIPFIYSVRHRLTSDTISSWKITANNALVRSNTQSIFRFTAGYQLGNRGPEQNRAIYSDMITFNRSITDHEMGIISEYVSAKNKIQITSRQ